MPQRAPSRQGFRTYDHRALISSDRAASRALKNAPNGELFSSLLGAGRVSYCRVALFERTFRFTGREWTRA